ncbi:DUF237 domain-containing protein [Mycoplasmoides genitalium]|uniref:Uncharacterized protein MG032 n=1 Tax=Mycoplasma genitalium (strain ATCC 33530 / DSM 19775 / NCTC 10195 / G37) TaxID=243273 RepID=Y032_MYCGE|nr:DUF237 domain-containing protein [Mycoplasmoides genitalium]P47278.1 RecName: Full=Uncharacterized protein MG032 [Mycoplasmoides genitalium G37]AAC71248.1 conserved hypothetical protein [Mycoplasmoides genitalium G37]ABY79308.1 conserved hypothetical protein [synthetic Mycoplasma genitalium JCVI-1.0]
MKTIHKLFLGLCLPATLGPLLGIVVTNTDQSIKFTSKSNSINKNNQNKELALLRDNLMNEAKVDEPLSFEKRFENFKNKYSDIHSLNNSVFSLHDVYDLLGGFKQSLTTFFDEVIAQQQKIKDADKIFPSTKDNPPKEENPNVLDTLANYQGAGFFPSLGKNGFNLPEAVFQNFTDFRINDYKIKNFNVDLVSENDIIKHDKVRYAFEVKFNIALVLSINKSNVDFDFDFILKTDNFSDIENFNEIFNRKPALQFRFYTKINVHKLSFNGSDSTYIANILLQDQFNLLEIDLNKSIYALDLENAKERFDKEFVQPLYQKRREAKLAWEEEQRRIAEEQRRQEEERARILKELKEKAEKDKRVKEAQNNLQKALGNLDTFFNFFSSGQDRVLLGFDPNKYNVQTREGLFKALQISYSNFKTWTFYISLLGWKEGSVKLLKKPIWNALRDDKAFQYAFGLGPNTSEQQLGRVTLPGYGYEGIRMSDWLRWALGYYTSFTLSPPKNVEANLIGDANDKKHIWISPHTFKLNREYGDGERFKGKAYRFKLSISFELEGHLTAHWWTIAFRGSIPGSWSGKLRVTHEFDGDVPYYRLHTTPPQYRLTDDMKLLFVPHSIQRVTAVGNESINGLLRSQNLHNLERQSYEATAPIDLISYMLYAISDKKPPQK